MIADKLTVVFIRSNKQSYPSQFDCLIEATGSTNMFFILQKGKKGKKKGGREGKRESKEETKNKLSLTF